MKRIVALIDNKNTDLVKNIYLIHKMLKTYYPYLHLLPMNHTFLAEFTNNPKDKLFRNKWISILFQGNLFYKDKPIPDEVYILNLYHKYKNLSFVKKLNGSFNFLLFDSKKMKLYVVSDKYASRPLYWSYNKNQFVTASEVKIILDVLKTKQPINWSAWGQYLTYRYTLDNNTFYKNINLIEPATIMTCDLSKESMIETLPKIEKYWDYSEISIQYHKSEVQMINEGVEIFKKVFLTLGKQIRNKKLIIPLSGGYDSRGIVSSLNKFSKKKDFDTITTLHPAGSEKEIVDKISKKLNIRNKYIERPKDIYKKYFIIKAFLSDAMVQEHLWVMPMLKKIKRYDTCIDGIAGDIVLRSTRVRPVHIEKQNDTMYLSRLFKKQLGFDYNWLKEYIDPKVWKKIKYTPKWAKDCLEKIEVSENRFVIFLMIYRIRNGVSSSPNNIIGSQIIDVIQPYFNDDLVTFGLSIPHKYKFDGIYRKILDSAFPELKDIKSTSDINLAKEKEYDQRILEFNKNPRELIADYLEVSKEDKTFLFHLFKKLESPSFINKPKFLKDYLSEPKFNRLVTILDFMVWYNLFENETRNLQSTIKNIG